MTKKTTTKKRYYCIKCRKELKKINIGGMDVMAMFAPPTFYCENNKCDRFGLITIGAKIK